MVCLFALFKAARRQKICDMSTIAATEFLPLVATAGAAVDSVVVSLHDVAPRTQQIARTIISELSAHGVRVCSILVVPDYHHESPLAKHREFVTWLRALEADGHEVVIHGYFHERPPQTKETCAFIRGPCLNPRGAPPPLTPRIQTRPTDELQT